MSVEKIQRDITNLFNYPSDPNPTTQADYINAVKNWVGNVINLVDISLWQPETAYTVGNAVKTPSLPSQYYLICTTSGTSGSAEPDYTDVGIGDSVTDGTVTWRVDSYLSLSGGTLTGDLIMGSSWGNIKVGDNTGGLTLYGYPAVYGTSGAFLALFKYQNGANGHFNLSAANNKILNGNPDGTLTWVDKEVERVNAKGGDGVNGYIRYESGLQICWAYIGTCNDNVQTTWTFPVAFKDTHYALIAYCDHLGFGASSTISTQPSATTYGYIKQRNEVNAAMAVSAVAIGFWK